MHVLRSVHDYHVYFSGSRSFSQLKFYLCNFFIFVPKWELNMISLGFCIAPMTLVADGVKVSENKIKIKREIS